MIELFIAGFVTTLGVIAALGTVLSVTLCFGVTKMYISDRKDRTQSASG